MIVYQINCWVDDSVVEEWDKFFVEKHLDDVFNTGCFSGYSYRKAIASVGGKVLFNSEYYCYSEGDLEYYNQHYAKQLKQDVIDRFEGKFTASRTVVEMIVERFSHH